MSLIIAPLAVQRTDVGGERLAASDFGLIAMLATVVMFEGFDVSLTSVVLPYLGTEYDASSQVLSRGLKIIALGSIAAWGLIRLSDRFARRPILLLAIGGFALGSLATVMTFSVNSYIAIQFVARLSMVTYIPVEYLLITDMIAPSLRRRVNGILGAAGSFGAALPFVALPPHFRATLVGVCCSSSTRYPCCLCPC